MPAAISPIVQYAIEYANRGWLVFPCHSMRSGKCSCGKDCGSPGKHPRTKNGVKDAALDADVLTRWWAAWPDANIGLATGKESGLFAIDIDPQKGGPESLVVIESQRGRLPPSLRAKTGSGGWHFFYKYPADIAVKNRQDLGGFRGVDVRGDGGYVIAAPSNHASGNYYEWLGADDLADAPAAWLEFLAAEPSAEIQSGPKEWTTDAGIIARAIRYLAACPPAVSGQGGHGRTFAVAGSIVQGFGIEPSAALGLLLTHYNPRCMPPWRESELRHKINDAASKPSIKPFGWLRAVGIDEVNSIAWDEDGSTPAAAVPSDVPRGTIPTSEPKKPRPLITNVTFSKGKKTNKAGEEIDFTIWHAKTVIEIASEIQAANDGSPVLVSGQLMSPKPYDKSEIPTKRDLIFFAKHREFFAWMRGRGCKVYWPTSASKDSGGAREQGSVVTLVNREEIFEHLKISTKPDYASVECLPHEPVVKNTLYLPVEFPEATGEAIKEFTSRLNPETEIDRGLLLAALLTPAWGGEPGKRPAFVFTSRFGKGTGKSTTAEWFCEIFGGRVTIRPEDENWSQVHSRLLSNDALATRCILIDNAKKKLQGQELEYLLTTPVFDGHKMYVGQMSRPNRMTTFITANAPSLGSDLATRAIKIQFGRPKTESAFDRWIIPFMEKNRMHLLADIYDVLRGDDQCTIDPANSDRWALWQDGVLAKLPMGNDLAAAIKARRPDMDTDAEEADEIRATIEAHLVACGHDLESQVIRIPAVRMYDLLRDAGLADKSFGNAGVSSWLRNLCDETGPLLRLIKDRGRATGRAWLYLLAGRSRHIGGKEVNPIDLYGKPPENPRT